MRVVVTGGRGFIGSATVRALVTAGHEVKGLPHLALRRPERLRRELDAFGPDHALHLAWTSGPDRMSNAEANDLACADSVRLIEALPPAGCRRLVAIGSVVEAQPETTAGQSPYAVTKRAVHRRLSEACSAEFSTLCAHVFGVMGPGEPRWRAVPQTILALLHAESMDVSAGKQRRDILHVDDVASALVVLLESDVTGTVDVCSGESRPLRDLFHAVEDAVDVHGLVRYGAARLPAADLHEAIGNPDRLRALGWKPTHTWESAVADAVAWWKEQS